MSKSKVTHAPYDSKGNLMEFTWYEYPTISANYAGPHEWRLVEKEYLVLHYSGYSRGQSSTKFTWISEDGRAFPMFVSSMDAVLKQAVEYDLELQTIKIRGYFQPRKMGRNWGIEKVGN